MKSSIKLLLFIESTQLERKVSLIRVLFVVPLYGAKFENTNKNSQWLFISSVPKLRNIRMFLGNDFFIAHFHFSITPD